MRFRKPRRYYSAKREATISILGLLAQFAAATIIAGFLALAFADAVDKHQQRYDLTPGNRSEVIARW